MKYIKEKKYQKIIKLMPIFYIDFLISFKKNIFLLKEKMNHLKFILGYWRKTTLQRKNY